MSTTFDKGVKVASVAALLASCALASSADSEKPEVPVKYGIIREDCLADFFADSSCLAFSFSKLVGYLIIAGAFGLKLPQINNILKAGSCKGVSATSYYFETLVFLNTLAYSMHLNLSFTVYGETIIILAQNFVVILLIYQYDKTISIVEKFLFCAFFVAYSFVLLTPSFLPEEAWPLVSSSCVLLNISARVPQIYNNWSEGSTGVLAFATFLLSWLGSIARTATVFIESDDTAYRMQFLISLVLNTIIIGQFALYWNSDKGKTAPKADSATKPKETKKTQ